MAKSQQTTPVSRVAAALVIIIFFIPYTASGFSACGKLFSTLFGMDYLTAMLISAAVIVIYTVMGGFLAASFTDLIQSIIMTVALVVVLGFGVTQAGGVSAVLDNARSLTDYLSVFRIHDPATGGSNPYSLLTICSLLAWGLGYFGMPHILVRFMAIEDEKKLKLSRRVASSWVVISMAVAIIIGLVGNAMTSAGALEQLADAETIIVRIASLISQFGALPALLAGVILAGILAATMSTADSQLLAASSSVSQDLGNDFLKRDFSGKRGMIVARIVMIGISLIAAFLARDPDSSVFRWFPSPGRASALPSAPSCSRPSSGSVPTNTAPWRACSPAASWSLYGSSSSLRWAASGPSTSCSPPSSAPWWPSWWYPCSPPRPNSPSWTPSKR